MPLSCSIVIVNASSMRSSNINIISVTPMCSIIIVGVGRDDFSNMATLDGDARPYAVRDIVQVGP